MAQQNKWLETVDLKKISLRFIHIDTDVWRSELSSTCIPEICSLNLSLNSKKLFYKTNSANLTWSLAGIFVDGCSSNFCFKDKIPSFCGMLVYRSTTSAVSKNEPLRIFPAHFILSMKPPESRIYDQPFCINVLNKYEEILTLFL